MPAADSRVSSSLAASGQSAAVHGTKVQATLSGTWTGTVKLQVDVVGTWTDTGDSWTTNQSFVVDGASPRSYRLDFTRTSGTLVFDLMG